MMSPRSIRREVTGLWAPSLLMPDWSQDQVSRSSTWGWLRPISRTMAWVAWERDLIFRHADGNGLHGGRAADIGDARALLDPGHLLVGLHHAHPHGGLADIDRLRCRQRPLQLAQVLDADVVELDADPPAVRDQCLHGCEIIVPVPIGIDEVVPEGPAPGLRPVHIRRDRGLAVLRDDEAEQAREGRCRGSR